MLRRRALHKDMADVNVYTAKRLKDMADSLGGLAKTFAGKGTETGLSREDGDAAMEAAAAMVCGDCAACGLKEESYYIYYLLRTFEQKGQIDFQDMPRRFLENCRKKQDYLGYLNRSLGRATMNLSWKNRFLESRDAVVVQFQELAGILDEFSGQMERARDVTAGFEAELRAAFKRRRVAVENLLVLQYEDRQRELFVTAHTTNGRCVTAKDAAEVVGEAMRGNFTPARDGKTIVTRNAASFRFIEDGKYRLLFGARS